MALEKEVMIALGAKAKGSLKGTFGFAQKSLNRIGKLASKAFDFGKIIGVAGIGALTLSVAQAREFGGAMAEVSTIVDTAAVDMGQLNQQVLGLSRETGKGPRELAQGLYQTISAGVGAGEAMEFLDTATRASIAGVAETSEAVDLLTNVMNAYGKGAYETGNIADVAFKTVEKGKTTFSELAASMGQVLPFAAQLDVSLEDLFASTATLTKGGIDTANGATYLKGVMAAVIKPTDQAARAARRYGIDMSVAHVKSVGFGGFLDELKDKTEGNTKALARMFPNLRGLTAVLGLTGKQAEEFRDIQQSLTDSTGAMGKAFDKVSTSDAYRFDKALNRLRVVGIRVGSQILPDVVDVLERGAGVIEQWASDKRFAEWWREVKIYADATAKTVVDLANNAKEFARAVGLEHHFGLEYEEGRRHSGEEFFSDVSTENLRQSYREQVGAGTEMLGLSEDELRARDPNLRRMHGELERRSRAARERGQQQGENVGQAVNDAVAKHADGVEEGVENTLRNQQVHRRMLLGSSG